MPHGLWRSIEHMRKGEKSLIMIKPKWGYGYKPAAGQLIYPPGYESEE